MVVVWSEGRLGSLSVNVNERSSTEDLEMKSELKTNIADIEMFIFSQWQFYPFLTYYSIPKLRMS